MDCDCSLSLELFDVSPEFWQDTANITKNAPMKCKVLFLIIFVFKCALYSSSTVPPATINTYPE